MEPTDGLYGSAAPRHNPGEHQHIDGRGAAPQQRPRAAFCGRPRRQHVIDQYEFSACHLRFGLGGHAEGALDVLRSFGLAEPDLAAAWP